MSVDVARLPITVGVGAFMVRDGRLLVVRRTYGLAKGLWTIPSGYVEPRESIVGTLEREVLEETAVRGRAGELLAVRNRVTADANDTFLMFRMRHLGGEPKPDGQEVSAAAFVPVDELAGSEESAPFTRALIAKLPSAEGMSIDAYDPRREEDLHYLLFLRPSAKGL